MSLRTRLDKNYLVASFSLESIHVKFDIFLDKTQLLTQDRFLQIFFLLRLSFSQAFSDEPSGFLEKILTF